MEPLNQDSAPAASPDPALVAHVAVEAQAQAAAAADGAGNSLASATVGYAGETTLVDQAEFEAARQKARAEHDAYERKQDRKQIAALVLAASPEAVGGGGNLAIAADRAVNAAEALLDRLARD